MKGNDEVLTLLNNLLTNELTAINQYFIHAKMCENWGFERLAHKIAKSRSMRCATRTSDHADSVPRGRAELQRYHKLRVGETVKEQFESDLQLEYAAIAFLTRASTPRARPTTTRPRSFTRIFVGEEQHTDWLETQLELIKQVGDQNYLAQQMKK